VGTRGNLKPYDCDNLGESAREYLSKLGTSVTTKEWAQYDGQDRPGREPVMTELEIGWLSKVLDLMVEKGCNHLHIGEVDISVFVDSQHPRTCAKCLGKAPKDEPAPVTQRNGPAKQEELEPPKFRGPIEIGVGPDGEPVAIIDPDLLGLGKE
jgi:hypothetical protein